MKIVHGQSSCIYNQVHVWLEEKEDYEEKEGEGEN